MVQQQVLGFVDLLILVGGWQEVPGLVSSRAVHETEKSLPPDEQRPEGRTRERLFLTSLLVSQKLHAESWAPSPLPSLIF